MMTTTSKTVTNRNWKASPNAPPINKSDNKHCPVASGMKNDSLSPQFLNHKIGTKAEL